MCSNDFALDCSNAAIVSKKPAAIYLKNNNSKINILRDREFLKSREVLLSKKKQLVLEEAKGNQPHAANELSEAEEDICCFALVNLVIKTLRHFNVQFGGYWHFSLDSEHETKAKYSDAETLFFKQTEKLATKF